MKASHAGGLISLGAAAPPCPAQPWHSKQPTVSNSFLPLAVSPLGAPWAKAGAASSAAPIVSEQSTDVFIQNTSLNSAPHPPVLRQAQDGRPPHVGGGEITR